MEQEKSPLQRAMEVQLCAAAAGFDWRAPALPQVLDKVIEEVQEVREAPDAIQQQEELGDLLFAVVNAVRCAGYQPGALLDQASNKFARRWEQVQAVAASRGQQTLDNLSEAQLAALWFEAKRLTKSSA